MTALTRKQTFMTVAMSNKKNYDCGNAFGTVLFSSNARYYRLGQIPRKPANLNFCRQTRGKVGKHGFLVENYSLNTKKLFTRPDFEFLTVKLQI